MWVATLETILKSLPEVPVANVWVLAVRPFKEAIPPLPPTITYLNVADPLCQSYTVSLLWDVLSTLPKKEEKKVLLKNPELEPLAYGMLRASEVPNAAGVVVTAGLVPELFNVSPMELFKRAELGILVNVLVSPEIDLFVSVAVAEFFVASLVLSTLFKFRFIYVCSRLCTSERLFAFIKQPVQVPEPMLSILTKLVSA